ncbi:MAG: calcium/proton exchanger [Candidatus Melainabacteria bacterium]|nr:calcium/proton exchanger [Candidatus Melainabacteria bacterium]
MKLSPQTILNVLLIFVPLPILGKLLGWPSLVIFLSACLGIVPLAGLMGKATETLADRAGAGLGGFLNATFGNACELLIALSALRAGLTDVVKASITGSIIGNILLVLGFAMLAGGFKYKTQYFNRTAATTSATLLALAAVCLVVPTVFHFSGPDVSHDHEDDLALAISIVQLLVYMASLYFSLKTHKNFYVREMDDEVAEGLGTEGWGLKISIAVLATATVLVAVLSECLVGEVEHVAHTFGMSQIFIGVILVAIVGNAAEHSTAVLMAMKNKMDLSINIALGSSSQIAMFVAPVIVITSFFLGKPMDLVFSEFEVMSVVVSVIILPFVATDGECNWLEGVQLLAVYVVLGLTFFLI